MSTNPREHGLIRRVAGDVLRLVGATGLAQVVAFATSPLITRLYNPEAFGHFAVFAAVLNLLLPLASLRYDWAVPLPVMELRALELFALCLLLVVGSSIFIAALATLVGPIVAVHMDIDLGEIMLFPLGIILMGLHALVTSWLVRNQAFMRLAMVRFSTILGTFVICEGRDLSQFRTASFDLILFSFNGIDYLSHAGRLKALTEIRRVLAIGGVFVFSSDNHRSPISSPWNLKHRPLDINPSTLATRWVRASLGWEWLKNSACV